MLRTFSRGLLALALGTAGPAALAQTLAPAGTALPFETAAAPAAPAGGVCAADTEVSQGFAEGTTFIYGQGNTAANDGTAQELGQSLTAPCDGVLSAVGVVIQAQNVAGQDYDITLLLFEGAGTDGASLGSERIPFTLPNDGAYFLDYEGFDAVPVSQGDVVTAFFDSKGADLFIQGIDPGGYAGGSAFVSTSGTASGAGDTGSIDLRFTATFQPPPATVAEPDAAAAAALSAARPNPTAGTARLDLTAPTAQAVTVAAFDALGREVARLHDGPVAAGAVPLVLDAAALPPGVYVVRAVGETFTAVRTVSVAR